MADLEGFSAYARIEDDDPSAKICYDAAISAAHIAGVPEMEDVPAYDLMIYALGLHYYDNRGFSPGVAVDGRTQDDWVSRRITAFLISLGMEGRKEQAEDKGDDP